MNTIFSQYYKNNSCWYPRKVTISEVYKNLTAMTKLSGTCRHATKILDRSSFSLKNCWNSVPGTKLVQIEIDIGFGRGYVLNRENSLLNFHQFFKKIKIKFELLKFLVDSLMSLKVVENTTLKNYKIWYGLIRRCTKFCNL